MADHAQNGHTALMRPRYLPRMTVTAADLTADQDYFRERLRRHNRLLHGCGVICGLFVNLGMRGTETALSIAPGAAISALGDEIEVPEAVVIGVSDFCFMTGTDASRRVQAAWPPPGHDPCPDDALTHEIYYLGVCARELERSPRATLRGRCNETTLCESSRLQDSYQFVLLDSIDPQADCVEVAPNAEELAWRGEYYRYTPDPTGTPPTFPTTPPDLVRQDAAIDFTWVIGAPAPTVPADHFMVRWTRRVYFPAGRYRFITETDDGVRLSINGMTIIDRWTTNNNPASAEFLLPAGTHELVMEYYEVSGTATARLHWEVLQTGWYGEYFPYTPSSPFTPPTIPTTPPALVRIDPDIGFAWDSAAPGGSIGGDNFMARWTRDVDFCQAALYEFVCRTDDGMRLFIDGVEIPIDAWRLQSPTIYRVRIGLSEGRHRIRVEFFEFSGSATAQVYWHPVGPYNPGCTPPPSADGCVVLAALSVRNGQIVGVENFNLDPARGYQRKVLASTNSLAERIACMAKAELRPSITQIVPGSGTRGSVVRAIIFGSRLGGATGIAFSGAGVTGRVLPGSADSWLPIEITIESTAALGARTFTLMTPQGALDSALYSVDFHVEGVVATPSPTPTVFPTIFPTFEPTVFPTIFPTIFPTFEPTVFPTIFPTFEPTIFPTFAPTIFTFEPTFIPTFIPTFGPTFFPLPGREPISPVEVIFNPGTGIAINPGDINVVHPGENPFVANPGGALINPELGSVVSRRPFENLPDQPMFSISDTASALRAQALSEESAQLDIPVTRVKGIGQAYATKLAEAGVTTAQQLASIDAAALMSILDISNVRAGNLIDSARRTLEE
jgi:hypothetical protein